MNLTDNEIIKALECCCKSNTNDYYCEDCPYEHIELCAAVLSKDCLYLINRKTAEIERLEKSLDNMTDALVKTDEACRKAKSEAIKEFAELIKKAFPSIAGAVDFMVKEMVGE